MGNRAVITTRDNYANNGVGVYLHWNGGRDSVEAFLKYCELKGYRTPDTDCYGWARLCQVISNFFGGSNSIGIDVISRLDCDNWDNGVYIIEGWEIVDRKCFEGHEQQEYKLIDMLLEIDKLQPENERLGEEFITAEEIPTNELKVGQFVYLSDFTGRYERRQVVGIGEDKVVNGTNVEGIPYINGYGREDESGYIDYSWNINNYIRTETVRVVK